MTKTQFIPYNRYFFYPFLAWVIAGGYALLTISKHDLFYSINSHYTDSANVFMYYTTWMGQAEIIMPCLLMLMLMPRFRNRNYFITAIACNLIPFLVQHFLKTWFNTPRPLLLFSNASPAIHYLPIWPKLLHTSFPSGHSQGAGSFFCFLSLLLTPKYRIYGFIFFLAMMLVCYSRIYLAAHFFNDVYAGSTIGVMLTSIIFAVMSRTKFSLKENISAQSK